jgi:hypothetical protein
MLNTVLKTLPLTKNIPAVGAVCIIFDSMGVLPVTGLFYKFYIEYEIQKCENETKH